MQRLLGLFAALILAAAVGVGGAYAVQAEKAAAAAWDVSPLETQILGQTRWLRGGPAALRVIVLDHRTGKPVRADVAMSLARLDAAGKPGPASRLFAGATTALGTLDARFTAPSSAAGSYQLSVAVAAAMGKETVNQRVELQQAEQILLTADKPLYQPGQTIHLRALALDKANRRAVADQPLTFEVEDARGNKVFKKRVDLSRFGVAATDFVLADEVNMGTFTLRAILAGGQAEKKVRVERYVLPKFKIAISTDKPYYLPGETVKGTIQTDYFFGKPVAGGKVAVTVNTIDIGVTKLAELQGKTDATGAYKFDYKLPESFVGQPFEQGKAVAEFQARVTDTADHLQMQARSVPVVKDPILIVMAPEAPQPVPGLPNRVYIACGTPDGAPVKGATLAVSTSQDGSPLELTTDSLGLATYQFTPKPGPVTVAVKATSTDGLTATSRLSLTTNAGKEAVLLRTDKTLAKVGDTLQVTAMATARGGTIYVDMIRNKQTILTRGETAQNGRVNLTIPITNDMTGTVEVHAYKIMPSEDIIRDSRTVVVSPADDLVITATADRQEYRPGADALLKFAVRSKANQPIAAAIGLAIVDESVFALSELQPGLEKVYFMLERELMEPRYEIHGLRPSGLVVRGDEPAVPEPTRQRAAAMLLASAPKGDGFDVRVNTYLNRWAAVREKLVEEMVRMQARVQQAVQKHQRSTGSWLTIDEGLQRLVDQGYLRPKDIEDPWGHDYKVELYGNKTYNGWFALSSAGPDGKWGTVDDVLGASPARRRNMQFGFGRAAGVGGGGMMGGRGMEMEERFAVADGVAAPMGAAVMLKADKAETVASKPAGPAGSGAAEPRVRQYFPETMYWNPAVITDDNGKAELRIPMADSITTWRMSMLANGAQGQLGSATAAIKAFQDFFVDIDLPVSLTQNDRVEIPVAIYNYLAGSQEVTLTLEQQPWFKLEGSATRTVTMQRNEVRSASFPITVTALGRHTLKVVARGAKLSDAIMRSIDVTPDGKEFNGSINDRLEGDVSKTVTFPKGAVPGANALWVKLYPGAFSQVVEGLDGLLRMPNGCFEQTSSTTYPNVLVTDYLKATKKTNPELQMKAEGFINAGYQRLVTFECKGGGFSWFGSEPAHQVLTAYGLLEFSDMAKVHEVDPALISRTQQWLAGRQKADGTWPEDGQGIAEGIINRQTGALRTAAYIAWALAESGYKGPQLTAAVDLIRGKAAGEKDAYTLALILNLMTKTDREGDFAAEIANRLIGLAKQTDKAAWWEGGAQTFTGAQRESADLETTGLAAYGLAKWGRNAGFVTKVLTNLVQSKNNFGTWSTTQGTVWAMKALLFASANGVGGNKGGTVTVWANGAKAATVEITPEDSDVMRQIDLREQIKGDAAEVKLTYTGDGSLLYQIASRWFVPWSQLEQGPARQGPLSIDVAYDKTTLAENDTAAVTVSVRNNTNRTAEMPLIDLGVPPGFTVITEGLDEAVKAKRITKYTLAARQIIVYMDKLDAGSSMELRYAVKAKFPIKAKTPLSKVYPYYNPESASVSQPQIMVVTK